VPQTIADRLLATKFRRTQFGRRARTLKQKEDLRALQEYEITTAHHAAALVVQR
jgi:hypothetical protein